MLLRRGAVAGWLLALLGLMLGGATPRAAAQEPGFTTVAYVLRFTPERVRDVQAMPAVLRHPMLLELKDVTLEYALHAIAAKAGLDLAYSRAVVPLTRRVSVTIRGGTTAEALRQALVDVPVELWISASGKAALVPLNAEHVGPGVANGSIAGRVTDAKTQTPLGGATVVVQGISRSVTTGNDGRYRIAGVAPGTYTVRARYIGYAPGSTSVTVSADQEATADLALEKSAQRLDEVVTTGTVVPTEVKALPTPVSVISDSDIALQGPRTVQELLRQAVPTAVSWDLPASPASTTFSTRGASTLNLGGAQMKVFIDGIEAASASAAALDPNSIEHIEVIRGPQAAAIYGSDAIGGVIQVFTKRGDPNRSRPQGEAQAALGTIQTPNAGYGTVLRQSYKASVQGGGTDVSYSFGAGYSRTPDYVQPVTAQSNPSAYGGMQFARGVMTIDVTGRYYVQNAPPAFNPAIAQTGLAFYSKPNYKANQNQNHTLGARISVVPTTWWYNTVTAGIDRTFVDQAQTQPRLTTPSDTLLSAYNFGQTKTSIGYTTAVQGTLGAGLSGSLTAGFDHYSLLTSAWFAFAALQTTGFIPTDPGNPPTAERNITNNTGYFAQAQLGFHDVLFLTGGLRAERNNNFGDSLGTPLSPRVGLSFVQTKGGTTLKVRGSWGRAIRPPAPAAKLANVTAFSVQLANPQLGPERQRGWDAGLDAVFGARGSLSLTYYDQTAENLIQLVQLQLPVLTYQYENVGRVKNTGIELEGALSLGLVQLKGQYGYTRARVEQLAPGYTGVLLVGDQTLATPKHTAGAALTVSALRGTTLTAGATYVGSWNMFDYVAELGCFGGTAPCQPSFRNYVISYPSFTKINAAVWQQITPSISGFVAVDNLTNRAAAEYENFEAVIGRVATIGLRFKY